MTGTTAEKIENAFRIEGRETAVIRLIEDHFRYGYVDMPEPFVEELRASGIYDPTTISCGEENGLWDISSSFLTADGYVDGESSIWKTPCGHSRLWTNDVRKNCSEGDVLLVFVSNGKINFMNTSDQKLVEKLGPLDEVAAKSILDSIRFLFC